MATKCKGIHVTTAQTRAPKITHMAVLCRCMCRSCQLQWHDACCTGMGIGTTTTTATRTAQREHQSRQHCHKQPLGQITSAHSRHAPPPWEGITQKCKGITTAWKRSHKHKHTPQQHPSLGCVLPEDVLRRRICFQEHGGKGYIRHRRGRDRARPVPVAAIADLQARRRCRQRQCTIAHAAHSLQTAARRPPTTSV